MNRKGLFFLVVSIIIAVSTIWLNGAWLSYKGLGAENNEKQIDYYLSDFSFLQTSTTGEMKYYLQGQHLTHKNATGGSEIFLPTIQTRDSDGTRLFIQAKKALQEKSQGNIELSGTVLIQKNNMPKPDIELDKPSLSFKLETENLVFNPVKRELSTNNNITLTTKDGVLTGIGLRSKLDQQELRILSNVHAKFDPNP